MHQQQNDYADAALILAVANALRDWEQRTDRQAATKILREAVWFYWQAPRFQRPLIESKYPRDVPWSDAAAALSSSGEPTKGRLVIEHVEPLNRALRWLVRDTPTIEQVLEHLPRRIRCAVVTTEEAARLPDSGSPQERYREAQLDLEGLRTLDARKG